MTTPSQYNEFFRDFLVESMELLQHFESTTLELDGIVKDGPFAFDAIEEKLQSLFRNVHTLKGLAGMMEFDDVKIYSHEAEEVLNALRYREMELTESSLNVLFTILDTLKMLIGKVAHGDRSSSDVAALIASLTQAVQGTPALPVSDTSLRSPTGSVTETTDSIRVQTGRLDDLMASLGELVLAKNRLAAISKQLQQNTAASMHHADTAFGLSQSIDQMARLIGHLQDKTMKLRMVPISYSANKFQRLVRDLSRNHGKAVELEIEGENSELDRRVMEAVEESILHILRNAVDHGIETPEERRRLAKSPCGTIRLQAFHESNRIVIRISDDGRGIDADAIWTKAVEQGLLSTTQFVTPKDLLNFVFVPGFSTAQELSDTSGRGVGMDVVKKNIQKLNGQITLESEPHRGTTLTMKLPLTLAVIQVLLVDVGTHRFALPLSNVIETLRVADHQVEWINDAEVFRLRDRILPIVRVRSLFGISDAAPHRHPSIVVVTIGDREVGIVVDRFIDQQDVVIKPLGRYLDGIPAISGAAVLGNGTISLVMDPPALWEIHSGRQRRSTTLQSLAG
jgi:two-component system chemotaxis sensor kinase CheA